MGVKEVLFPMRPILFVCLLCVQSHDSRENLCDEQDRETGTERWEC